MKRAVKTKYYIKMLGYDTMVSRVQIARLEYERQMKSLKRQVELSTAYPESEIKTWTNRHETEKIHRNRHLLQYCNFRYSSHKT